MSIYDFILNEKFMQKCDDSNITFSDAEKCYIIYHSFAPINKKIDAFEEIIETSTDEKLVEQLKTIIENINNYFAKIQENGDDVVFAEFDNLDSKWSLFYSFEDAKKYAMDKMILLNKKSRNPEVYDYVDNYFFKIRRVEKSSGNPMKKRVSPIEIMYNYYGKEVDIVNNIYDGKLVFESAKTKMPTFFEHLEIVRKYSRDPEISPVEYICCNFLSKSRGCVYYTLSYDPELEKYNLDSDVDYESFNMVPISISEASPETLMKYYIIKKVEEDSNDRIKPVSNW